ncbi:MAG TPA: acetyl-CoA carboxylase biotin carboxyl carrier protein, partial [Phycisphaerales bacterium]|nr:acetyl-CoA carboxylase biotin carboxyl carrier protein [Phycisphaerales bacterium]
MDIRKLKELVKLMVENELSEIDLRDQEEKVTIRRGGSETAVPTVVHQVAQPAQPSAPSPNGSAAEPPAAPAAADEGLVAIESPMVGTFYAAANPDSEPFVGVGSQVSPGTVVCIVEAMKVFNEIKAECSGTIERVC